MDNIKIFYPIILITISHACMISLLYITPKFHKHCTQMSKPDFLSSSSPTRTCLKTVSLDFMEESECN